MPLASLPSGIDIFYEQFGNPSDPALLLMHGLGSQMLLWDEKFCTGLTKEGLHVIRFDSRDSGLSSRPPDGTNYTLSDMAKDVLELMDFLEINQAHIGGLSMGGMIAQTFASNHSDRCLSLISMASNTGNPNFGRPANETFKAMMAPAPDDPEKRIEKELTDRRLWASTEWHDEEHARALFHEYEKRSPMPRSAFERQAQAALTEGNREEKLEKISVPTLVIHGTADTLISQSGGERTAEVIHNAELVLINGWGHDVPPGSWPHLTKSIVEHVRNSAAN
ncbi:MAG TPA: alpha/beta hydrolase [Acidimicrobiales bacterium]|nr:alpha/beta hydrolase [Acidimicrobiales bacterium]|tara:strand:+ start:2490 stop:3326 length:837 start_codon:yes stop_codon:yes gene_type:complete